MRRVLVTGITGQDGAYLAQYLLEKGYDVYGTYRRLSSPNFWRLHYLGIYDKVRLLAADMTDSSSLIRALEISQPAEVYNLAAQSFVGVSFDQPLYTTDITGTGVARILEAVRKFDDGIKFYQASSSEMYGNYASSIKGEQTPMHPASPYAIAKLYGYWTARMYRDAYGMYVANGILFNHESPIRGLEFVTRKISNGVAKISLGLSRTLNLGHLDASRDWGYAPEYARGMWAMLQQKKPDDYTLATGRSHTIREFVDAACRVAGISPNCIVSSKKNLRPNDVESLRGSHAKAKRILKWSPTTTFKQLVKIMVDEDIARWQRWTRGEYFPWDAGMAGEDSVAFRRRGPAPCR